jgi:hypothetical protein
MEQAPKPVVGLGEALPYKIVQGGETRVGRDALRALLLATGNM